MPAVFADPIFKLLETQRIFVCLHSQSVFVMLWIAASRFFAGGMMTASNGITAQPWFGGDIQLLL